MKTYKKLSILLMALAMLTFAGGAFADVNTGGVDSFNELDTFLGKVTGAGGTYTDYTGDLSGSWDLIYLGAESANTNVLKDGNGDIIFKNQGPGATPLYATAQGVDLTTAYFQDLTDSKPWYDQTFSLDSVNVLIFEVTTAFTLNNIAYNVGDLIIGLNDNLLENRCGTCGDDEDYDDLVLVAKPTPIPGAVWLLGSGLMGLIGIRRKITSRA